jgi:MFS transporter, FHS family, glucose/mannose:H+ symporter
VKIPAGTPAGSIAAGSPLVPGLFAWLAYALSGWRGLLVPSLIRSIEADFGQTDAGMGTYFLIAAVVYAAASFLGGALIRRLGYRWTFGIGGVAAAAGLLLQGTAATWTAFVLGVVPVALGAAATEVGINALVLDLFAGSRGRALNLLHLAYSVAAMCTPVIVAVLVAAGVPWQVLFLATGVAWLAATAALVAATPRRVRWADRPTDPAADRGARPAGRSQLVPRLPLVLLVMAVAIGCYVASEGSISDWLVRFLAELPIGPASAALTLFWAGIAAGRLVFARVGDRFEAAGTAAAMALAGAVLLLVAVLAPVSELSLLLFGAVGVAFGPVYPLIMAGAGARMPDRSAAVASVLTFAAVIGVIAYPPLVGFLSVAVGLQVAMLGTAALAAACGAALLVARRMPVRR